MDKNLDNILDNTKHAKEFLEKANQIAKKIGDNGGSEKISKVIKEVEKISKDFENIKENKK